MNKKVSWGVLGTANIAVKKVIPAMLAGELTAVSAIASRDEESARAAADSLGIPRYFGSYDALLHDPDIDAVYIPLPNHLHLEWTTRAAEAGKHVLCEKPIGLNGDEVRDLIGVRNRTGVLIQEAFMIRTHPTWIAVKEIIASGRIGTLNAVTGFFSYYNDDPSNIRNDLEKGGGALLDIGCYCVNVSRFVFGNEPTEVSGLIERDPQSGIDRLSSSMMRFASGHSTFTCSTQLVPYQSMIFFGTKGRLEVQIPFNIPVETTTNLFVDDGSDLYERSLEKIEFEAADQYTIQGDVFSKAIMERAEPDYSLEDSFGNMSVLDAIFRSAKSGRAERPEVL
ncbi:MAG: Gfo/Idh/MocA family oxidoreductase [Pyrinomonadaceae bacterium]|nr:Gfo/Idh/MocA family oxidoreductase [Pyrinomonadaceae bacterium]